MNNGVNDNEQPSNVSEHLSGKECRTDASGVNENVPRAFAASNASKDSSVSDLSEGAGKDSLAVNSGESNIDSLINSQLFLGSVQWSGMLPDPKSFRQYPAEVQQKLCDWNDASTVDESIRQDRLVDLEIKTALRGQWIGAILFILCLIISFIAFLYTKSQWSWVPLALPALSFLRDFLNKPHSKSSQANSNDDKGLSNK
ncbi:hypothetical protein [Gardnerella sp. DNF01205]|uniref:hypothetical protein n=1 Tax=Gardnerella sp. DNF01205 TaxID=2749069 RepID=UPI003BA8EB21